MIRPSHATMMRPSTGRDKLPRAIPHTPFLSPTTVSGRGGVRRRREATARRFGMLPEILNHVCGDARPFTLPRRRYVALATSFIDDCLRVFMNAVRSFARDCAWESRWWRAFERSQ